MARKPVPHELGARERQILDTIYRLGEASVADVHEGLPDPPSYSAVRTMIRLLESKGLLKHRVAGVKYIYRPAESRDSASKSAISHLLQTFFRGSAADALAAMLDASDSACTEEELARMRKLVEDARRSSKKSNLKTISSPGCACPEVSNSR